LIAGLLAGVLGAAGVAAEEPRFAGVPELGSSSGSPLLLDIRVEEPPPELREIIVETGSSTLRYAVDDPAALTGTAAPESAGPESEAPESAALELTLTPFLVPGVYDLRVHLVGGEVRRSFSYEIGFVDFVWGRDNFRFGNNADYESRIGDYSEVLGAWLDDRFGGVSEAAHALLVHYMYGLFGENAGRCYAFAGSELLYYRNPELLRWYYDDVYDIRMRSSGAQRDMHLLQLDIVYDYFVSGGAPISGRQNVLDVARELVRIRRDIGEGTPVVTGYISPDLHHAMLVYGYIVDRTRGRVDLLVANNWKSGQDVNVRSRDAEIIRVDFDAAARGKPVLQWRTRSGPRRRAPHRMFVVPVRETYDHDRGPLEALLAQRFSELRSAGTELLVAENVDSAWLVGADGAAAGYRDNDTLEEIDGVVLDRVKESMLFEYPAGADLELRFLQLEGEAARLFHVAPGEMAGSEAGWTDEVEAPADAAASQDAGDGDADGRDTGGRDAQSGADHAWPPVRRVLLDGGQPLLVPLPTSRDAGTAP
jgi:hypothetical protein